MIKKLSLLILLISLGLLFSSCHLASKKPQNQVTILLDWVPNTNHTGIFIAQYLGYFKDEGLFVKIEQPPQESSTALVAAGKVEFAVAFQDFLASALISENPLPIKTVAAIAQHNTSGIICKKSSNISSPYDLQFKNYSTFDNPLETAILKHCVEHYSGNFNNVNLVPAKIDNIGAALRTNIDAAFGYFGIEQIILNHFNIDSNFLFFKDIDPNLDCYTPILISNTDYINKNPDIVKKVLRALSKGYTFAAHNPQESANILVKCVPELNYDITIKSQKYMSLQYINDAPKWGIIDETRWNNYFDWLYQNNIIDKPIKHGTSFTNAFLEN